MCDPLTIAGIALTGASVAANSAANASVAKARNRALEAERQRQNKFSEESAGYNTHAQDTYKDFGAEQGVKAQQLGDYFTGQEATPSAEAAIPVSSSNLVVSEGAKQDAKAKAFTDRTGTALGNLRSFGDVLGADSRSTARDAGYVGQVNNFKQGSSAVVPFELDAAGNAGNGMKMFGDILGGLGGLATAGGLSGASLGSLFGGAKTLALPAISTAVPTTYAATTVPRLGALF